MITELRLSVIWKVRWIVVLLQRMHRRVDSRLGDNLESPVRTVATDLIVVRNWEILAHILTWP